MPQYINIKPLSVNICWQGRRFKTRAYKLYEKEMLLKIKQQKIPISPLHIDIIFYLSNPMSDIDNPIKPFLDILQKRFGINDRDITMLTIQKTRCEKQEEKIWFDIETHVL